MNSVLIKIRIKIKNIEFFFNCMFVEYFVSVLNRIIPQNVLRIFIMSIVKCTAELLRSIKLYSNSKVRLKILKLLIDTCPSK